MSPRDLTPSSKRVLDALSKYTTLAWPILKAQCDLVHRDPGALKPADLTTIVPKVAVALGRFTTPQKAASFETEVLGARAAEKHPSEPALAGMPSRFAGRLTEALCTVTALAPEIVKTQCARAGLSISELAPADLPGLAPALVRAVGRFTTPQKAEEATAVLEALGRAR